MTVDPKLDGHFEPRPCLFGLKVEGAMKKAYLNEISSIKASRCKAECSLRVSLFNFLSRDSIYVKIDIYPDFASIKIIQAY